MRFSTDDEALAFWVAVEKIARQNAEALKGDAKALLAEQCEDFGCDRKPIRVNGVKVGNVSMRTTKARAVPRAGDPEALAILRSHGALEERPARGYERLFSLALNGAIVDRATGEDVSAHFYWQPETVSGATVTGCKPEDVARAFTGVLGDIDINGMLTEGTVIYE